MKTLIALASVLALSACGADGPPKPPPAEPAPGLSMSGQVTVGISG